MNKIWKHQPKYTPTQHQALFDSLYSFAKNKSSESESAYSIFAQLLLQRGISTIEEAIEFNNISTSRLHDPFAMLHMDIAVARIIKAIHTEEKIMVYGDYDVDGTTSVALMMSFLRDFTPHLTYYIPDRYNEGYGISFKGIETAESQGISLIIALDCGIKAIDQVAFANSKNIDFIICDHHTPGDESPNACAILNPKQKECTYPYKELPGCGIGFKLCQALSLKLNIDAEKALNLLDLVAISIACDIVPITGENRILASLGLQLINTHPKPNIASILESKSKQITISDLVFQAGPRINAAGRISSGKTAVDLLLANSSEEISSFSSQISNYNSERKKEDQRTTEEALQIIHEEGSTNEKNTTVLYNPDWHKGVIGIVASRVIEHHYRPTVIITKSKDGVLSGSVRSVKGFNVYNALEQCQNEILQFGGHQYAAGLTLKESQLSGFKNKFEETVTQQMTEKQFTPEINYDVEIQLSEVSQLLKKFIDKLEPFGPMNMTPTFVSKGIFGTSNCRAVGQDKSHLKLELTNENKDIKIPGIAFGLGHLTDHILTGQSFDIAFSIDINYWNNMETLQLMVKDIKF
ncbi:single-stranded-DNA-specific exonuclease RecJ [bacterium SCSIO 12643]|nr:single-stranded-DNA-specific exonuclease RecJ [bacterium SCSIO 12643]